MTKPGRNHSAAFKARVTLEAIRGEKMVAEIRAPRIALEPGDHLEDALKAASVAISMDGKGRWIDNVFIELLWRSVKIATPDGIC
jgi:hypothetical protein